MNKLILIAIITFLSICAACSEEPAYYPKPRGDLRLSFPEHTYSKYTSGCNYSFEIPQYFEPLIIDSSCNRNMNMGPFNATLFLTYLEVDTSLALHIDYARKLAYEHSVKADEIKEIAYINRVTETYGLSYEIVGDAASPYQFYLTDSAEHFLRGALYFNTSPNYDSIKPSFEYIRDDIRHLIETTIWE